MKSSILKLPSLLNKVSKWDYLCHSALGREVTTAEEYVLCVRHRTRTLTRSQNLTSYNTAVRWAVEPCFKEEETVILRH
jgi:hypothetical protein